MMCPEFHKIYDVPRWKGADGSIWCKHLHALHFAGDDGWAVGSGQVLYTKNRGVTWTNLITSQMSQGISTPERVFVVNDKTVWVLMLAHRAVNNCFYSDDGGKRWYEKRLSLLVHPKDIFFLDATYGWIISDNGAIPANEARIHVTANGGSSWDTYELEIKGSATKLKFLTPEKGFLIQHTSNENRTRTICNLLMSCDGGRGWRVLKSFTRLITDFYILSENDFVVVGERGFISRTSDGGLTWSRTYTRTQDTFNVVEFSTSGIGVAAGDFGLLMVSGKTGSSWTRCKPPGEVGNFVGLSFVENDHVIAAASRSIFSIKLR